MLLSFACASSALAAPGQRAKQPTAHKRRHMQQSRNVRSKHRRKRPAASPSASRSIVCRDHYPYRAGGRRERTEPLHLSPYGKPIAAAGPRGRGAARRLGLRRNRGREYGENRVVAGVHFPSDIERGRLSATAFSPRRHRCLAVGRNEASRGLDQIGEGHLRVGRNDEVDLPEALGACEWSS